MGRSPEALTKVEPTSYGTRMVIQENEGQGAIFAADYMPDGKALNLYWPAKTDLSAIKRTVNEANNGEAQWIEDVHGDTLGVLKNGRFWFSPMHGGYVPRAGMQLEITDHTEVDSFLETVAQLASKTCADSVNLPLDLTSKLKQFTASLIQPKNQ